MKGLYKVINKKTGTIYREYRDLEKAFNDCKVIGKITKDEYLVYDELKKEVVF